MNHAELIERLGGGRKLHRAIERRTDVRCPVETAVYHWKAKASIPSEYWPAIIAIAGDAGVPVTMEGLAKGSPQRKRAERGQGRAA